MFLRSTYTIGTIREEIGKRYNYSKEELALFQLEEVLEFETEDSSEKEISDNYQNNNLTQYSTKKNEAMQAIVLHALKYLSISSDVLTPPPKSI